MNPSSANPVHNDPDIRRMHPDVSDHLDSEIKLWPKVGQVASTMNFGPHYEFSVTLV
jgi:hypothetical protein